MSIALVLLAAALIAWDFFWPAMGIERMSPTRLKSILRDENGKNGFVLADVRTAIEFGLFHIPGSINYPDLLHHPAVFPEANPDLPVIVICLSGHRSPVAAYRLKKRGFRNVSYLPWGMIAWVLSGGKTVSGEAGR